MTSGPESAKHLLHLLKKMLNELDWQVKYPTWAVLSIYWSCVWQHFLITHTQYLWYYHRQIHTKTLFILFVYGYYTKKRDGIPSSLFLTFLYKGTTTEKITFIQHVQVTEHQSSITEFPQWTIDKNLVAQDVPKHSVSSTQAVKLHLIMLFYYLVLYNTLS